MIDQVYFMRDFWVATAIVDGQSQKYESLAVITEQKQKKIKTLVFNQRVILAKDETLIKCELHSSKHFSESCILYKKINVIYFRRKKLSKSCLWQTNNYGYTKQRFSEKWDFLQSSFLSGLNSK